MEKSNFATLSKSRYFPKVNHAFNKREKCGEIIYLESVISPFYLNKFQEKIVVRR